MAYGTLLAFDERLTQDRLTGEILMRDVPQRATVPTHVADTFLAAVREIRAAVEALLDGGFVPDSLTGKEQAAQNVLNAIDHAWRQIAGAFREWSERAGEDRSVIGTFTHDAGPPLHLLALNVEVIRLVLNGELRPKERAQFLGEYADRVLRALSEMDRFVAEWRLEDHGTQPSS